MRPIETTFSFIEKYSLGSGTEKTVEVFSTVNYKELSFDIYSEDSKLRSYFFDFLKITTDDEILRNIAKLKAIEKAMEFSKNELNKVIEN